MYDVWDGCTDFRTVCCVSRCANVNVCIHYIHTHVCVYIYDRESF